jgi:hypothetical protein
MRYNYVTLRATMVCEMTQVITNQDAYISKSRESEALQKLLAEGYRWVWTYDGWAVFEKAIKCE